MTLLPRIFPNKGKRIVLRKIRRGRVKINGYWFEPDDISVPLELEGKRCAFGVYWTGSKTENRWQIENFVSLWGSEEMHNSINDESFTNAYHDWGEISTDNDGFLNWAWWRTGE